MPELSNDDINNFQEWSEGNNYLFELLCNCKKNGIITFASCGGHEVTLNSFYEQEDVPIFPYLGIVIDEKSLPFIKEIISELKDMKNIQIDCGFINDDEHFRAFTIRGHHSNCCEMFHRINCAVIDSPEHSINSHSKISIIEQLFRNAQARQLYKTAKKVLSGSREELAKKKISYRFNTYTREFSKFVRSEGNGFGNRDRITGFDELYKKYGHLEREYSPIIDTEPVAFLQSADEQKLPSWDLRNWSQEELEESKRRATEKAKQGKDTTKESNNVLENDEIEG